MIFERMWQCVNCLLYLRPLFFFSL
eukprot:UN03337